MTGRAHVAEANRGPPANLDAWKEKLRRAGLRSTRQRIAIAGLLFGSGNRHLSAERLFEEALAAGVSVSLATIYNVLHQFTETGLLREVAIDGSRIYFDTNTSEHHHVYLEDDRLLLDAPPASIGLAALPEPPPGFEITHCDVVVRVKRKG